MQTFVPESASYAASLRTLSRQHLGKQRSEALGILRVILKTDKHGNPWEPRGWVNHTATSMWRRFPLQLLEYTIVTSAVWRIRGYEEAGKPDGYNDTVAEKAVETWIKSILNKRQYADVLVDEFSAMDAVAAGQYLQRLVGVPWSSHVSELKVPERFVLAPPPDWWGDPRVHGSHRRALYWKNPEWYGERASHWEADKFRRPGYTYFWPEPSPGKWGEPKR